MDETPINLENILEQAPKWTFAGDFTLLQWMNQISQDLETRATKTTEALAKLNNNVRSTNIALDNVANSLTTLQFGNQFVECRVQDDDETLANANEDTAKVNDNPIKHTPTSKEILNQFLDNNLKVLRNCHEKYSIDLDDSDEDEEGKSKEKTCIYQPINPYNEKPLPFIFGSKDWHAKWHVGLYENQQENNYSGDEISEAFSESSSTSHLDDNESFESNTEWASSNSIDNDNLNTNIEVKNASTLRGSQAIPSVTPSVPISAAKNKATVSESSSLSTPSSSLSKQPLRNIKQTENLTQRSESKNSLNSKISSQESTRVSANNQENPPRQYKQQPPPFVDLFGEPPDDIESTTSSSVSSAQHIVSHSDNNRSITTERPPGFRTQPQPFVDLFAEPPEDIPSSTTSSSISSGRNVKRKTVNLFDDDEDDSAKDDLLTTLIKKDDSVSAKNADKKTLTPVKAAVIEKPLTKTRKSLFEDSDGDDDDFLKAFAQRSKAATKSSLTKTLLFDNEFHEPSLKTKSTKTIEGAANLITDSQVNVAKPKIQNIFNDTEDNEDDLFVNKTKDESKNLHQKLKIDDDSKLLKVSANVIPKKSINLFDDSNDDISDKLGAENVKKSVNIFNDFDDKRKDENLLINKKPKKINLFDDLDDDEGDDLFSIKTKQTSIKNITTESNLEQKHVKSLEVTNKDINTETATENSLNNNEEKPLEVTNKQIRRESIVKETLATIPSKSSFKENEVKSLEVTNKQNETESNVKKTITNKLTITAKDKIDSNEFKENTISNKQLIPAKTEEIDNILVVEENNNLDNNENNEKDLTKFFKNEEKQLFEETTTNAETSETQSESTNLEKNTKLALNHKELNNNDNISIIQEKSVTIVANDTQTSNPSNKYDFNSMLLFDEPPEDDNEFFETLTKTPQAHNNNYNAIDLEHDLYEPELPKVPVTSASNNQTDSTETKQTSLYSGLQLFSDIPPDDDDTSANDTNNQPPDASSTKRLHSVFYDDFNETLMALNQNQAVKDISVHSIFNDEPPPINEELSSLSSKDTIDHKVPDVKQVETSGEHKLRGSEITPNLEETLSKSVDKNETAPAPKRPVSKLQMPHININVQALLPGANNAMRKTKEDTTKSIILDQGNDDVKPDSKISLAPAKLNEVNTLTKPIAKVLRTVETEHILPSVTKNRVRGPAARRPSTRRARQENYRKSMLEESSTVESNDDESKELQNENLFQTKKTQTKSNNSKTSPKEVQTQINKEIQKQIVEKANNDIPKTNPLTSLFKDKQSEQSNILNVSKNTTRETKSLKEETQKPSDSNVHNLTNIEKPFSNILNTNQSTNQKDEIKQKPTQTKSSLLFDDDEDDDNDDLFKHIKTSKTITKEKEVKLQNHEKINSSIIFANNSNIQVTKDLSKPSTSNVDNEISSTTKTDNKTPQPIKQDDNLLNKSETDITKKPSFFDDEDDDESDLFKSNIQSIQKPNNSKTLEEKNRIAKSKFKSFLESESDEDHTVAGLQTTTKTTTHTTIESSKKNPNPTIPSTKDSNAKLFSDSDTDSDDLFGKLSSTKTSNYKISSETKRIKNQKKAQTKSSLFSDESENDFPTSSKNVGKNIVPKSSSKEIKPKTTAQTNASLFSDVDSDEDDLFGSSGSAKVATTTATNITNLKAPEPSKPITSTAEITKAKTVADNPLADLL